MQTPHGSCCVNGSTRMEYSGNGAYSTQIDGMYEDVTFY